jgi:hypothetical protein
MPINAELQKWLAEKALAALPPEQQQQFNSIIGNEAVAEQLNRAWMAPPDYNRKMDELKAKEAQLKADADAELQRTAGTLKEYYENWRTQEQARVNAEVAALQKQVRDEGLEPVVQSKPAATNSNGNGEYLTKQEAAAILRDELSKAARFQAYQTTLVERHRQMFGDTPDMNQLMDVALKTGRPLEQVWYETHKVADKEKAIQEAAIQKRIDDGISERLAKMAADGAMGQQNFGRQSSPSVIKQMMQKAQEANANSPLAIPQPIPQGSEAVRLAEELLRSGKFETKQFPGQ